VLHAKRKIQMPNVSIDHVPVNRSTFMKEFLYSKQMKNLNAVIFDRFFSEEAYSFHFYNEKPNVLRILDMQDMHSLRFHRQSIVDKYKSDALVTQKSKDEINNNRSTKTQQEASSFDLSQQLIEEVISSHPNVVQNQNMPQWSKANTNSTFLRELASIHRSDLTLVCSPFELELLRDRYGIPPHKLALASFFVNVVRGNMASFEERCDFVTVGGFKHQPNVDQVKVLKYNIWPSIRKQIPQAKLHIYGAYPTQDVLKLHDEASGFLVKGYTQNLEQILNSSRLLLCPLRFGAGIKGKIVDAWKYGCPVISTPIGAEGMTDGSQKWGGKVTSNANDFIQSAIQLYCNKKKWEECQITGLKLTKSLYCKENNFRQLDEVLKVALKTRHQRRESNFFSGMLWHQSTRSTEYFSRWIELKEKSQ